LNYIRGDEKAAYSFGRSGISAAQRADHDRIWRPADRLIARMHLMEGPSTEIAERLIRHKQRSHDLGLRIDEADATAMIGLLHAVQGEFDRAHAESAEAVALAEGTANEIYLAASEQFRGMVRAWQGDVDGALTAFAKAGAIAEARGDLFRLYVLRGHRGAALISGERFDQAVEELEQAIDMAKRLDTTFLLPFFTAWRAEAALGANRDEEVLDLCRDAFSLSAQANQPWARSLAFRALARALLRPNLRDLYRAEKAIRAALEVQRGLGLSVELAHSSLVHARILRARGDAGRSSEAFSEAGQLFDRMGMHAQGARASTMAEALKPGPGGSG
jgi:tetratricopeptide (TPR) repeat protein